MSRAPKPAPAPTPIDDDLPPGVVRLANALDRWRLTYRLDELAEALGVSRRTIERERSAGRFPPPDLKIGKAPLWKPETIRAWIDSGGGR